MKSDVANLMPPELGFGREKRAQKAGTTPDPVLQVLTGHTVGCAVVKGVDSG